MDFSYLGLMWNDRFGYFTFFVGEITKLATNLPNELNRYVILERVLHVDKPPDKEKIRMIKN